MEASKEWPVAAIWMWECSDGWLCYDVSTCHQIEKSYQHNSAETTVSIGSRTILINFVTLTQLNRETMNYRRIRRVTEPAVLWEWEESPKVCHRFLPAEETDLEKMFNYKKENSKLIIATTKGEFCIADTRSMRLHSMQTQKNYPMYRRIIVANASAGGLSKESPYTESINSPPKNSFLSKFPLLLRNHASAPPNPVEANRNILKNSREKKKKLSPSFCKIATSVLADCNLPQHLLSLVTDSGSVICQGIFDKINDNLKSKFLSPAAAQDDNCAICFEQLNCEVIQLKSCKHYFHEFCFSEYVAFGHKSGIVCPTCSTILCTGIGPCPKGNMTWFSVSESILEGYENLGSIFLIYSIPSGTQSRRHPHPGASFVGTMRYSFLPDNKVGRWILDLLKESFTMGHTFTIATSVTTGRSNTIVWNGIHHKTSRCGGSTQYGYPDENYFIRVINELKDKGITVDETKLQEVLTTKGL